MKKISFIAVLAGVAVIAGCGKPKTAPAPVQTAASQNIQRPLQCRRPVFRIALTPLKEVSLSELAKKGAKKLQLVSIEDYTTFKVTRGNRSRLAVAHTKALVSPTSTVENLEVEKSVICEDLESMRMGSWDTVAFFPFQIDLTDGTQSPLIKSDLEMRVKVFGPERGEAAQLDVQTQVSLTPNWDFYLDANGKRDDQYTLYEISPGRIGLTVEKTHSDSVYVPKADLTQINEFEMVHHAEFIVE